MLQLVLGLGLELGTGLGRVMQKVMLKFTAVLWLGSMLAFGLV